MDAAGGGFCYAWCMRVLLNSIGTAGDIHPFIALGLALKARGHEVLMVANPYFAARINGAGVGFWPMGKEGEYLAFVRNADLVNVRRSVNLVIDKLIVPSFDACTDAIDNAWRAFRPDVVVAHHISFGAQAASQKIGLPLVQCVLSPMFWLSRYEPVLLPQMPLRDPPKIVDRLVRSLLRPVGRLKVDRKINKLRRAMGLGALRDVAVLGARGGDGLLDGERLKDGDEGTPVLGLWSEHFRGVMKDDPRTGQICGFCAWDRPVLTTARQQQLKELCDWMENGPAPVLVTLGSSVSHHGKKVYAAATAACRNLDRRVVLLTGPDQEAINDDKVRSIEYAPYSVVMPRAQAVVHHAGIGTTAAAMRAGRPSLILPHANDEFDNAERARRLGVAVTGSARKARPGVLSTLLERVLEERDMATRAKALGEKLSAENGAAKAAVKIEGAMR